MTRNLKKMRQIICILDEYFICRSGGRDPEDNKR